MGDARRVLVVSPSSSFFVEKPVTGLSLLVGARKAEGGSGFVEFEISSSTISTALRQPLAGGGRLRAGYQRGEAGAGSPPAGLRPLKPQ